jgi:hypothetical protein
VRVAAAVAVSAIVVAVISLPVMVAVGVMGQVIGV